MPAVFYDDNTTYLILDELRDSEAAPGTYINTATVTLEWIKTLPGVTLTGVTFPLAMPFVASSNGKYRVKVPDTLAGAANEETVEALIKAIASGDVGQWRVRFSIRLRVI